MVSTSSAARRRTTIMTTESTAPEDVVDEEFPIVSDQYNTGPSNNTTYPFSPVQGHIPIMIPDHFTHMPAVRDTLVTDTSEMQDETATMCLSAIANLDVTSGGAATLNRFGVPHLDRARHARFLHRSLEPLPSTFVGYDPSRPWLLFWCLNGLSLLGEDVSVYRDRLVDTARSMQNASGGFGGGHGQSSHLATTYAVVMSLAIVGGEACYECIDRRALWKWLCSLKQPDGGFQISVGGEEDVRGAYCAAVIISVLNLPLNLSTESSACTTEKPTLYTGLANYVQRCQTYEGGISAQPGSEAHGGYAFCALGCLSVLDSPGHSITRMSDPYHTCYVLSGLSSAQHKWDLIDKPVIEATNGPDGEAHEAETLTYYESVWKVSPFPFCEAEGMQVFDEDDRVAAVHPVYTILAERVDQIQSYFRSKAGF
ncbi:CAAX farnesyltransferase (FTase) subunit beta [Sporothrix epigloea]|uniref:CAAX farnesyltransferase (FTase) subunit beta n=1 Tax=Sporothrix epigloea TaxID=1892477 RepID=A0ABP0DY25_9PEZI